MKFNLLKKRLRPFKWFIIIILTTSISYLLLFVITRHTVPSFAFMPIYALWLSLAIAWNWRKAIALWMFLATLTCGITLHWDYYKNGSDPSYKFPIKYYFLLSTITWPFGLYSFAYEGYDIRHNVKYQPMKEPADPSTITHIIIRNNHFDIVGEISKNTDLEKFKILWAEKFDTVAEKLPKPKLIYILDIKYNNKSYRYFCDEKGYCELSKERAGPPPIFRLKFKEKFFNLLAEQEASQ